MTGTIVAYIGGAFTVALGEGRTVAEAARYIDIISCRVDK